MTSLARLAPVWRPSALALSLAALAACQSPAPPPAASETPLAQATPQAPSEPGTVRVQTSRGEVVLREVDGPVPAPTGEVHRVVIPQGVADRQDLRGFMPGQASQGGYQGSLASSAPEEGRCPGNYGDGQSCTPRARMAIEACAQGVMEGCTDLGFLLYAGDGLPINFVQAQALFDKACQGGSRGACRNQATMLYKGHGVTRDALRAAKLFEESCQARDANACYNLGYMFTKADGVPGDAARGHALYETACELGEPEGCANLGVALLTGQNTAQDLARGQALNERACTLGHMPGCHNLGFLLLDGKLVTADPARARQYLERACKADYHPSCRLLDEVPGGP